MTKIEVGDLKIAGDVLKVARDVIISRWEPNREHLVSVLDGMITNIDEVMFFDKGVVPERAIASGICTQCKQPAVLTTERAYHLPVPFEKSCPVSYDISVSQGDWGKSFDFPMEYFLPNG